MRDFAFKTIGPGSVMGILNVTPDSFSEGGRDFEVGAAVGHGVEMVSQGAVVLDVGGEASSFFREGVMAVDAAEQLRRVLPVVRGLVREMPEVVISVDTRSSQVAEACLEEGASIVNDISAGMFDGGMFEVVRRAGAGIVLMHMMPGYPSTAETDRDIVGRVRGFLAGRVAAAREAGIAAEGIAVDPGIGFGTSAEDSWTLAMRAWEIAPEEVPVVLGVSRKRFLETAGAVGVGEFAGTGTHARDGMTAAVTAAIGDRVLLHRVHNVALAARAMRGAVAC